MCHHGLVLIFSKKSIQWSMPVHYDQNEGRLYWWYSWTTRNTVYIDHTFSSILREANLALHLLYLAVHSLCDTLSKVSITKLTFELYQVENRPLSQFASHDDLSLHIIIEFLSHLQQVRLIQSFFFILLLQSTRWRRVSRLLELS